MALTNGLVLYGKALTEVVKRVVNAASALQNKNRIAKAKVLPFKKNSAFVISVKERINQVFQMHFLF
jgi:hypothetical protein